MNFTSISSAMISTIHTHKKAMIQLQKEHKLLPIGLIKFDESKICI